MKMYENENGLRIDLDADDIEEFIHVNWIELNGSDAAENMVCAIAKECERKAEEMRKIEMVKLEDHEIAALETLGKSACPNLSKPIKSRCVKCPFHLNSVVALDSVVRTACLSIICRAIVRKETKNDQRN